VLENMRVPRNLALSTVRISIGPGVGRSELQALAAAIRRRVPQLLKATPA
jgi:hypothetical protein